MGLKRHLVTVELDEKTKAKLNWVAGRQGTSSHAFAKAALLAALAKHPEPPEGWGVAREQEDD